MIKRLLLASLSCACVCAPAFGGSVTPNYSPQDWFSVSFNNNVNAAGGSFASGSADHYEITGQTMVINSELDNPVRFDVSNVLTADLASVTFNLVATSIPNGARNDPDGARLAFAIYETSQGMCSFTAWTGSSWVTLSGGQVPEDGANYTLTVTFDGRETTKKVQFKVGEQILTCNSSEWIECGAFAKNAAPRIDFVGSGSLTSFDGDQLSIVSEIVVIDGGEITVNEEDTQAFKKTIVGSDYPTVEAFLAADAKTAFGTAGTKFADGLKVAEAYALGLARKDSTSGKMAPVDDGALTVKADAQANVDGGVPVMINIQPPSDTGATITYQLQGSTDGQTYVNINGVDATDNPAAIKIPMDKIGTTSGSYRFFKVKTTVQLKNP